MTCKLLLLVAVAALAVVVGCGSDSETTQSKPLTKSQFLKQANAICAETIDRQTAAFQSAGKEAASDGGGGDDTEARDKFGAEVSASVQAMVENLSDLAAPAGDQQAVEQMLDAYERGSEEVEGDVSSFISGKAFEEADRLASEYGMTRCAQM